MREGTKESVRDVGPLEHEGLAGNVDWNLGWSRQEKRQPGWFSTRGAALLKVRSCCWGFVSAESGERIGMTGAWPSLGKMQEAG